MTDIFPRRNLPPEAEQWGRAHDSRVIEVEKTLVTLQQNVAGQNRNTASSLAELASQINDLSGRVSYSSGDMTRSENWNTTQPTQQPWGPTLEFTLTEPRQVSVEFRVTGTASAEAYNNGTNVICRLRSVVFVNGVVATGNYGDVIANAKPGTTSGGANAYAQSSLAARALLSLPAGTHTVQGGFMYRFVQVLGAAPSGSGVIEATAPFVFVDVLQPS